MNALWIASEMYKSQLPDHAGQVRFRLVEKTGRAERRQFLFRSISCMVLNRGSQTASFLFGSLVKLVKPAGKVRRRELSLKLRQAVRCVR